MLNDLATLLWVEAKRARKSTVYWLKLVGLDPSDSPFYQLYFLGFWAVWLFIMWAFVVDAVYRVSITVPADMVALLVDLVPLGLLALQGLFLAALLWEPPLRLTVQEMTFWAASPVHRGVVALVQFLRSMPIPMLLVGVVSSLLSMFLTWPIEPARASLAGVQAFLLAGPLVLFTAALAWAVALLPLRPSLHRFRWVLWLCLPLGALGALLLPEWALWLGRLWTTTVAATLTVQATFWLLVLLGVGVALLCYVGGGVHMTLVADQSQTYARLQQFGMLGRIYARDAIQRVERQSRLARRRQIRGRLPSAAQGDAALRYRAWGVWQRQLPSSLFVPLFEGVALAGFITLMVKLGGWEPLQTWVTVLFSLVVRRPDRLVSLFRRDVDQTFMRQFIPQNNLALFAMDTLFSAMLTTLGGLIVVLPAWNGSPLTALLVPLVVVLLGLCQALELVRIPRQGLNHVPYPYTVLFSGVLAIGAGLIVESLVATVVVLFLINALLALLLRDSSV